MKKLLLLSLKFATSAFLVTVFLSGCASVPRSTGQTYSINGTTYFPLPAFCDTNGVEWNYDVYCRTATLVKGAHKVSVRVGDELVLVDGKPMRLHHPIDVYQGMIVGPYRFRQQILDELFGEGVKRTGITCVLGSRVKKVVIDAGHGGNDPGAIGRTGLREKDVNLDIAKRIAALLKKDGVEIILTRSTDRFIPLGGRVDIANKVDADLFISVHSNANRLRSMNGFEVYYVDPTVSDSKRAVFAAQNVSLKLPRSAYGENSTNLRAILWDMIFTSNRAESIELSRAVCSNLNEELGIKILGIKGARFAVLRGIRMPGVLIEVGFVSNREEEAKLKNGFYRQKIAEAVVGGVKNYCRASTFMEASKR
jgi:N-acetylmuramoyl-L-alanine amidase